MMARLFFVILSTAVCFAQAAVGQLSLAGFQKVKKLDGYHSHFIKFNSDHDSIHILLNPQDYNKGAWILNKKGNKALSSGIYEGVKQPIVSFVDSDKIKAFTQTIYPNGVATVILDGNYLATDTLQDMKLVDAKEDIILVDIDTNTSKFTKPYEHLLCLCNSSFKGRERLGNYLFGKIITPDSLLVVSYSDDVAKLCLLVRKGNRFVVSSDLVVNSAAISRIELVADNAFAVVKSDQELLLLRLDSFEVLHRINYNKLLDEPTSFDFKCDNNNCFFALKYLGISPILFRARLLID